MSNNLLSDERPTNLIATENESGELPQEKRSSQDYLRSYLVLIIIVTPIVILDQWTKLLVRLNISYGESWMPLEWLRPYVRIINTQNTGAAFGMFRDASLFFTLLAIVVTIVIIVYFPRISKSDWPLRVALGLQLAGALGNLTDRLSRGFVTDFFSVAKFPVFNVADSSIFSGVVVLLIGVWIEDRREKARLQTEISDEEIVESLTE